MSRALSLALVAAFTIQFAHAHLAARGCEVRMRTTGGWVCGVRRECHSGELCASFRGVPYAKQPVGALRFKELEPVEPWEGNLDATREGFICPQTDVFYGDLMRPRGMDERCIHANIHLPMAALTNQGRTVRELKTPLAEAQEDRQLSNRTLSPIMVFIHGGGFAFGSGDEDIHGPANLNKNGVIVITFNYRLNVFGFLSLNTSQVPGNNGLRDMIFLLRWVQSNAHFFGGNPSDVTLAGQSAGAAAAHLLTLSPQAKGLFRRAILMSGTALPEFYTTSPAYAKFVSQAFITAVGINSTDPDQIHQQLIEMPINQLMEANRILQDQIGLAAFFPVIESPLPGVNPVLQEDTEEMLAKGYGSDISLIIGFTNAECESFRKRFEEIDIMGRLRSNPLLLLSPQVTFSLPPEVALARAKAVEQRYFNGTPTMDKYLKACTDMFFQYPALKVANYRSQSGGAKTFMYQFEFESFSSPIKLGLGLNHSGVGHAEDLGYVFKVNSVDVPPDYDYTYMSNIMSFYFGLYTHAGDTSTNYGPIDWLPIRRDDLNLLLIQSPRNMVMSEPTFKQGEMVQFFDGITARS